MVQFKTVCNEVQGTLYINMYSSCHPFLPSFLHFLRTTPSMQICACMEVRTCACTYLCILYYLPVSKGVHVALHSHAPSDQVFHYFLTLYLSFLIPPSSLLTDTSHWLLLIGLHFLPATLPSLLPHSTNTVLWPPGAQVWAHK